LTFTGSGRRWLLLCAFCAGAAAEPPPASTEAPASPPVSTEAPAPPPDEGFLEFLGSDDVGDAAWWEFLKKAPPRESDPPPATPPQDENQ
jgi:hypothetical protein